MKKSDVRWIVRVVVASIVLATVFTLASTAVLEGTGYVVAVLMLLFLILIGILFDIIGVAVTAADETPFHSMAARQRAGAKEAIWLIKNASRVSSFCSDVVGDITGIISGTTMAVLAARLAADLQLVHIAVSLAISSVVVGLTIGGKAWGKAVAIHSSTSIVFWTARVLYRKNWIVAKITGKGRP